MDNYIPLLCKKYGQYINAFRAFPSENDGLKLVERRNLFSVHELAKDKFTKSARINGHTMGNFHPHGDTYLVLVNLVNRGLVCGQGSFGSNRGVSPTGPAAMRYTEVKSSKFVEKICFENIKYSNWFINDMGQKEPLSFPVMLPMCFLGDDYVQGIGYGFRTFICTFNYKHLIKRLMWLLGKSKNKPTIKPKSDCTILSTDDEIEKLLTTGEGEIEVIGKFKEDKINNKIYLYSWPQSKTFEGIISKIDSFEKKDVGYMDISDEDNGCCICFEVIRRKNQTDVYNEFLKELKQKITGKLHFSINLCNDGGLIKKFSVDDLLVKIYNNFVNINKISLESKIKTIEDKKNEYLILLKIRPYLKLVLDNKLNMIDKIQILSDKSKVATETIKSLFQKYSIEKLLKIEIDISELENDINIYKSNLSNIDVYVLNQYAQIENLIEN